VFLLSKNSKNGIQQTPISLIPIGHVTGIHSENLFYALQDESLTIGFTGSSNNVIKDGVVIIEHKEGDLLMMECSD
jgi:thiamine pyrophosphokinase